MPFPTCDPWPDNTILTTGQVAACKERSARAADHEMLDTQFLLALVDGFQRLAAAGVEGFEDLADFHICDAEENARNAVCVMGNITPPIQANTAELKQIVLWQLGNALCAI